MGTVSRFGPILAGLSLILAAAVLRAPVTIAADDAEKQETRHHFVLLGSGHVSSIAALRFSGDSSFLFSAGRDKRVRTWALVRGADGTLEQAVASKSLWWELSRDRLGEISAMDSCPRTGEVIIAGQSARGAGGDVAVLRADTGKVVRLLPPGDDDDNGHKSNVQAAAFSPDGLRIASADIQGGVRIWSAARGWTSIEVGQADQIWDERRRIGFLSNDQFLYSQLGWEPQKRRLNGRMLFVDLAVQPSTPKTLPGEYVGCVLSLAVDRNSGRWAVGDGVGQVHVWSGQQKLTQFTLGSQDGQISVAADLGFASKDTILISAVASIADGGFRTSLELWDANQGRRLDRAPIGTGVPGLAAAVSPDGRIAVGVDGSTNSLQLVSVKPDGKGFARRADGQLRTITRVGSALPVRNVSFAADGSLRVGLSRNSQRRVEMAFDLSVGQRVPDVAGVEWQASTAYGGRWSIAPPEISPDGQRETVRIKLGGAPHCRIELDRQIQGGLLCHAWIPDELGRAYAVAIGTDRDAVLVYELAKQGDCPLLRYYRDHSDWVTSLSVNSDGKWLASGSRDGTVKIWSLDWLSHTSRDFAKAPAWGAEFSKRGQGLVVSAVSKAGIAANRDLQVGDVVKSYQRPVGDRIQTYEQADEILRALDQTSLWQQVRLVVQRQGETQPDIRLVPGWEPAVSIDVDRSDEWAIWTPLGYYNASVAGDAMFGWLVNRGRSETPQLIEARQLREKYERPDVLRRLFQTGNILDALGGAETLEQNSVQQVATALPRVTIVEPSRGSAVEAAAESRLVARVDFPDDPTQFQVDAFLNGVPLKVAARELVAGQARVYRYEWPFRPSADLNQLKVRAQRGTDPGRALFAYDVVECFSRTTPRKWRVHLVGVGAAKTYSRKMSLEFAVHDVRSVVQRFQQRQGGGYEVPQRPELLVDDEASVTRETVEQLIERVASRLQNATADDLLVVFFSGHGVALENEFFFVPPDPRLESLNTSSAANARLIRQVCVSWSMVERLARLPCRKLFLLDACHAGAAAEGVSRLQDLKGAVRPLDALEVVVVAAARADQSALEGDVGGLFAQCWLKAMDGDADGCNWPDRSTETDGHVSLAEAICYVESHVPEISSRQNPTHSPLELTQMVHYPLIRLRK